MDNVTKAFALVGIFAMIPLAIVCRTVAAVYLWGWFIAQPFGMAWLSWPHAFGLMMLCSLATHQVTHGTCKNADKSEPAAALVGAVIGPMIALAGGWVLSFWV